MGGDKTTFTPGPWFRYHDFIGTHGGRDVLRAAYSSAQQEPYLDCKDADAALFVAAPDMYGALASIRDKVHAHNRGGEIYKSLRDDIRDICDAALAKARGES